jgi:proteasome lid subunit RPN8/RPN11
MDIITSSTSAHPIETGGVLLGLFTEGGRPWVVQAVTIESANAGGAHYQMPAGARPRCVDDARKIDPRLGYLGDWHSHPVDVGASDTDVSTIHQMAADPEALAPHPLLLIARRCGPEKYWLDLLELARWRLRRRRIVAAGGLEVTDTAATASSRARRKLKA